MLTLTADNFAKVSRDMIVAGRRVEGQYDAMIVHLGINADTASGDLTEAARDIVIAAYPDTDRDRLAGKNKNSDQRWLDARTVRAGLVNAVKRATPEVEEAEAKPAILKVSLSGDGGGSTVVPEDHPMYEAIILLLNS